MKNLLLKLFVFLACGIFFFQNVFAAGVPGLKTTFTALNAAHADCTQSVPFSGACQAASSRWCGTQGYESGFGAVDYNGNEAWVTCTPSSTSKMLETTFSALSISHPECNQSVPFSGACRAAADRWCREVKGYADGYGPVESYDNRAWITCLSANSAKMIQTTFTALAGSHADCKQTEPFTAACRSASSNWCRNVKGYYSGYGPVEYNGNDAWVVCLTSDDATPVVTNNTPSVQSLSAVNLAVTTSSDAACKYVQGSGSFDFNNSGTLFATTASRSHVASISGLATGQYSYTVICKSALVEAFSPPLTITFTKKGACANQCSSAGQLCTGDNTYQVCADNNNDGCLELITTSCSSGQTCFNGTCSSNNGSAPVITNNTVTSQFTSDIILTVSTDINSVCRYNRGSSIFSYDSGAQFSSTGGTSHNISIGGLNNGQYTYGILCKSNFSGVISPIIFVNISRDYDSLSSSCSNECSSGVWDCSGKNYRVCGNYDSDICTEWSPTLYSCPSGNTCSNGACVAADSASPYVSLRVNGMVQTVTVNYGSSATISWSTDNVTSCTASGDWSGFKPVSGQEIVGSVYTSKNYSLSCTGTNGTAQSAVSIIVNGNNPVFPMTRDQILAKIAEIKALIAQLQAQLVEILKNNSSLSIKATVTNITRGGESSATITARPGDILDFAIQLTNNGNSTINGITIKDILPSGITDVRSTKLDNNSIPYDITASSGISNGTLASKAISRFTFTATVASAANFSQTSTTLYNIAQAVYGSSSTSASDTIIVNK